MRIVQLTPGSGDQFYCENCIRDASLVRAMRRQGADVVLVPMYLPLSLDTSEPLERTQVFFGGVNVYLQQKIPFFRKTPRWLDKLFDSASLLKAVSKKAGMTKAAELGEMTVSMLQGPQGKQAKEVDRLIEFLQSPENKPDVMILSNLLLAGVAQSLKEKLGCKLVCWLQDEDGFIDGMGDPWAGRVWEQIAKTLPYFDLFLPVSQYYCRFMQEKLSIPDAKMHVSPAGLEVSAYPAADISAEEPAIGYLGRMCEANGLDLLEGIFNPLVNVDKFKTLKLLICGGMTSADKKLIEDVKAEFNDGRMGNRVEFLDDFDFASRMSFLRRLSVLCCPVRTSPAYAMNVLEAMACGVPFVAPQRGVFPEWAELTDGGILYDPADPKQPRRILRELFKDPEMAKEIGQNGREAVAEHFDISKTAQKLIGRFETLAEL